MHSDAGGQSLLIWFATGGMPAVQAAATKSPAGPAAAAMEPGSGDRRRVGLLSGEPVRCDTPAGSEQGRGLRIVEALSAHWGWHREGGGKAVFAVLAREA
jgi:hypothetical protein